MRLWKQDVEFIDGIFCTVYTHVAWDCLLERGNENHPYTSKTQREAILGFFAFLSEFEMSSGMDASYFQWPAQPLDCEIMRVQEHVKLSTLAAVVALPWLGKDVVIPLTASVLIDVDHYLWHAVTYRTLSLRAAIQYFGQADPPQRKEAQVTTSPTSTGHAVIHCASHSLPDFLADSRRSAFSCEPGCCACNTDEIFETNTK